MIVSLEKMSPQPHIFFFYSWYEIGELRYIIKLTPGVRGHSQVKLTRSQLKLLHTRHLTEPFLTLAFQSQDSKTETGGCRWAVADRNEVGKSSRNGFEQTRNLLDSVNSEYPVSIWLQGQHGPAVQVMLPSPILALPRVISFSVGQSPYSFKSERPCPSGLTSSRDCVPALPPGFYSVGKSGS